MMRTFLALVVWLNFLNVAVAGQLIFPHYGDGGGLSMTFSISNLADETAEGSLRFFDTAGNPQALPLSTGLASEVSLQLSAHSTHLVQSDGSSNPPRSGFAILELDQSSVAAVAFFGFTDGGEAGIFPADSGEEFQFFVELAGTVNTGIAVYHDSDAALELELYDQLGNLLRQRELELPQRQTARLLTDLFTGLPRPFRGVLEVESNEPFAVTALRFGPGLLTSLPLIPTDHEDDFGSHVERQLARRSADLFGIQSPLPDRARESDYVPREAATADQRQLLAPGLQAEFVTRSIGSRTEQVVLYPGDASSTHLIACVSGGRAGTTPEGNRGLNASVQRVDLATGQVENILFGMDLCEGLQVTPWQTLLVTEETPDGRAYEILDPLSTTGHWIADRDTGDVRDGIDSLQPSTRVVQRRALPTMTWDGLAVLPSGVVLGAEEKAPGRSGADSDGGSIYKFVPDAARQETGSIADLTQSPLVAGRSFALQISCRSADAPEFPEFGQGCEVGNSTWVEVNPLAASSDADQRGATGFNRPEDLDWDPHFTDTGIRFCWAVMAQDRARDWGEVVCTVDPDPIGDGLRQDPRTGFNYLSDADHPSGYAVSVVERFFLAGPGFHSPDNLAFQPGWGNLVITEDSRFGEIFTCLPDGGDRDLQTDGCIRIASVIDPDARPAGFIFDSTGEAAYYIVSRGEQPQSLLNFETNPFDGLTADLIRVTGFRPAARDR